MNKAFVGFRVILKRDDVVFCKTDAEDCPPEFECIKSVGKFTENWDGVCCPTKGDLQRKNPQIWLSILETTCASRPEIDSLGKNNNGGWLERWYFNGTTCEKFLWNPEFTVSSNTFSSHQHCNSYCMDE